jgi:hypothetical protein
MVWTLKSRFETKTCLIRWFGWGRCNDHNFLHNLALFV